MKYHQTSNSNKTADTSSKTPQTTQISSTISSNLQMKTELSNPGFPLTPSTIMQLQKTIGNRAVAQLLSSRMQAAHPVQMVEMTDEEELQAKQMGTVQRVVDPEEEHIQQKPIQKKENNTGMSDKLKSGLESISGMDLSDVKVHYNSGKPSQLSALAYAQGNEIHIGPGQEQHLPHEGWHVIQQKQGRVKPTLQMKNGVYVNDDRRLEKEADVMGEKAAMQAVAQLMRSQLAHNERFVSSNIIQRKLDINNIKVGDIITEEDKDDGKKYKITSINQKTAEVLAKTEDESDTAEFTAGEWDDIYKLVNEPPSTTVVEEHTQQITNEKPQVNKEEQESSQGVSWDAFESQYKIRNGEASPFIIPLGVNNIGPKEFAGESNSKIAYVANILTVPGVNVQNIIKMYEAQGVSPQNYGSFAMVIGVNMYRSLDGTSQDKILNAALTAQQAPFPCVIVPFMWDFSWSHPFHEVQKMYNKMKTEEREQVLQYERQHVVQNIIPYGQLREAVTGHRATQDFVNELRKKHQAVYIHLGDDDAASLFPANQKKVPLLDRYSNTINEQNQLPSLVVGGYEFRTTAQGGDIAEEQPSALLAVLANQVDIWLRTILATSNPNLVYPTEPNLAFLAADGKRNYLEEMLTLGSEDKKRLNKEQKQEMKERYAGETGVNPQFMTGLLYGRGANEGGTLRENIIKKLKNKKQTSAFTFVYDPQSLGLATSSKRFTLHDDDKIKHEKKEQTYGVARKRAFDEDSRHNFKKQIVEDILTIKQSHVSGLKKEMDNAGMKKVSKSFSDAVYQTVKSILLDEDRPKLDKNQEEFVNQILQRAGELNALKNGLNQVIDSMWNKLKEQQQSQQQSQQNS